MSNKIQDLTEGDPRSVLWKFSIPMFISVIFQQLYSIADSIIAGKFAGEDALAAVGASYPVTMIFIAIAVGSNIGCSVVISQLFGAKRLGKMKTAIYTTLIASTVLSVILTVVGLLTTSGMMSLINTPANIFGDGCLYLQIYIGGFLFLFLYNIATGVFVSLGDSKTPLYFLIGSSVGNIVLDYIFVANFHQGVAGVAWATFIAQGVACVLALIALAKRVRGVKVEANETVTIFSLKMLGRIGAIAVPSILQQSFISVGNIFIQSLVNSFGSSVIAGYSAAIKLNTFMITSLTTLGNGVSNFAAQNMGARKYDRIRQGFRYGYMLAAMVIIPVFVVFCFFGNDMLHLFMDSDSAKALEVGTVFLQIVSPFYFVIGIKLVADGVLRGRGNMREFMISTFTDLILRVVLAYVFAKFFGSVGIWCSWPVGWSTAMILSYLFYRKKQPGQEISSQVQETID